MADPSRLTSTEDLEDQEFFSLTGLGGNDPVLYGPWQSSNEPTVSYGPWQSSNESTVSYGPWQSSNEPTQYGAWQPPSQHASSYGAHQMTSAENVPFVGFSGNISSQGFSDNVPGQGFSNNIPGQGYSNNVPGQGYSSNLPSQGHSSNVSSQGYAPASQAYQSYGTSPQSTDDLASSNEPLHHFVNPSMLSIQSTGLHEEESMSPSIPSSYEAQPHVATLVDEEGSSGDEEGPVDSQASSASPEGSGSPADVGSPTLNALLSQSPAASEDEEEIDVASEEDEGEPQPSAEILNRRTVRADVMAVPALALKNRNRRYEGKLLTNNEESAKARLDAVIETLESKAGGVPSFYKIARNVEREVQRLCNSMTSLEGARDGPADITVHVQQDDDEEGEPSQPLRTHTGKGKGSKEWQSFNSGNPKWEEIELVMWCILLETKRLHAEGFRGLAKISNQRNRIKLRAEDGELTFSQRLDAINDLLRSFKSSWGELHPRGDGLLRIVRAPKSVLAAKLASQPGNRLKKIDDNLRRAALRGALQEDSRAGKNKRKVVDASIEEAGGDEGEGEGSPVETPVPKRRKAKATTKKTTN